MDYTQGMQRTFEYYLVDADTWEDSDRIDTIEGGTIAWDLEDEQLGKATFDGDYDEAIDDAYVRVYMRMAQKGEVERVCVGTFLVMSPEEEWDGTRSIASMTGYTPLKEAADREMPYGYNVMGDAATQALGVLSDRTRIKTIEAEELANLNGSWVAEKGETALAYANSMLEAVNIRIEVDEYGWVLVVPKRKPWALAPSYSFERNEASVILPEVRRHSDLRDIPNVARVVYSSEDTVFTAEVVNDDPASPASRKSRGREVTVTETSPDLPENPVLADVEDYAKQLLVDSSAVQQEVTIKHAWLPDVKVGRSVSLYHPVLDSRVTMLVSAQEFDLDEACTVTSVCKFSTQVWSG